MLYKGSCHCGRLAFEVEGEIGPVIACNCPTCGIHPYAVGREPKQGREMAAINVRCLEGVDPSKLEVKAFDGRSL